MRPRFTISLGFSLYLLLAGGLLLASASGGKRVGPSSGGKLRKPAAAPRRQTAGLVEGQSATLLPDGRWLLVGGKGADGPLAAAAIRDPATGATARLPHALNRARAWHTATVLPDGAVLIFGGVGADGRMPEGVEVFSPEAGTFSALSAGGLAPRAYHTANLLTDGRVLIAGGRSARGAALRTMQLLDPARMTATNVPAQLQAARARHAARLMPNGGVRFAGSANRDEAEFYNAEQFDPEGQLSTWAGSFVAREDDAPPHLAASLPADGSAGVPVDGRVALRFSKPLRVRTVNAETVTLSGPDGPVPAKVVAAEGGMLAFVTPLQRLLPGATYTLSAAGCADAADQPLASAVVTFTTAEAEAERERPADGEQWEPELKNLRGDWRCNRAESRWQKLPPLQAPPGVTALAGQALTLHGLPLANVTLRAGDRLARTDQTGRFLLTPASAGRHVLVIDGRTANRPRVTYGVFRVGVRVEAGKTTALPFTIWMPKLDTARATVISSPTRGEVSITNPAIPGLELRLPAGTVIRDLDGQTVTQISITPVPTDRPPFPLPALKVPVFFTVQPGGSRLIPPRARLIYPNYTNERPGTRIDFWNYDPEERGWYVYGQGTVTPDGRQIVPDPGVVIYEFNGAMVANPNIAPPEGPPPGGGAADGDPVDLSTGLFVYDKTDLVLPDAMPIALTRTYRPRDTVARPFGIGTTHPYEIFLVGSTNPWTYADLLLPDGGRVHFDRVSPGTSFADAVFEHTQTPTAFYKTQIKFVNGEWQLTLKDGTVYRFPDAENATLPRIAALVGVRDRYGNSLELTRDGARNLTKITSPNGRSVEFTYDTSNRITEAKDNIGRTVGYAYDADGRLAKVTDPKGGATEYTYDASHRMLTVKDARGITYLTNEYDANGRVVKQTQADNTTFRFAYVLNASGRVTQTDVTDPRGNVRRLTFNAAGYALTDTHALGKPEQQVTTYLRQAGTNFVLSVTDALSRKTGYTYDAAGNVASVTQLAGTTGALTTTFTYGPTFNRIASVAGPLGHVTTFSYDEKGNLTAIRNPLNHETTFTYNAAGQLGSVTDPLGHTVRYAYDSGNLSAVTDPLGNTTSLITDRVGRKISSTDPLGRLTVYEYDALNRPTKLIGPQGEEVSFTYDANGNRLSVKDQRGNTTRYAYDNMDRVVSRTDPLLKAETYQYDAAGNLTKLTDRRGKVTTFTYDPLDRLTFTGFGQTAAGFESSVTDTYDAGNRLKKTVDSLAGTDTFNYDNLDRLTSVVTPRGTVSYAYDKASRRTSMTVAGQAAVAYAYDNANRLTKITQGTSAVSFAYDAADRRTSLTLPNGVVVAYGYNPASQVTGISYKKGAVSLGDLTYAYDATGRRVAVGGSFARTGLPPAVTPLTYNAANRLTKRGAQALTYDANGNLLGDGANTFTWDARNRLASISGPGLSASFTYDAHGRRVKKTVNGAATDYLYDGDNAVQELAAGAPKANMLAGGVDELFVRRDAAGAQTVLADALGSTLALTDAAGAIKTQYTYEPFGGTTAGGVASGNPSQFTGRENDGTGLYYYRARYYSPTLGRFISEDPIGFGGQDANLYAYVFNSPTNYTDSSGRIFDTIADIFFIGYDIYALATSGRKDNTELWLDLGADVFGAVVPGLSGGGVLRRAARHGDDLNDIARGTGKADNVFQVTKDGVVLPPGPKYRIPDEYVQNPHRAGSYGVMENGKFRERLRIDPATPPGHKGPNYSHYHLNGKRPHYSPRPGDKDPGFSP